MSYGEFGWQFGGWSWSPIIFYQLFKPHCTTNWHRTGLVSFTIFQNWQQKTENKHTAVFIDLLLQLTTEITVPLTSSHFAWSKKWNFKRRLKPSPCSLILPYMFQTYTQNPKLLGGFPCFTFFTEMLVLFLSCQRRSGNVWKCRDMTVTWRHGVNVTSSSNYDSTVIVIPIYSDQNS